MAARNIIDYARQILLEGAQKVAPIVVPAVELFPTGVLVGAQGQSVSTTVTTGALQIQWPCDGYMVSVGATCRDGTAASQSACMLRIVVDGNTELFTTGSAAGYVPFAQLSGAAAGMGGPSAFKTRVSFRQGTAWQLYIQNQASGTIVADICLGYVNTSQPRN